MSGKPLTRRMIVKAAGAALGGAAIATSKKTSRAAAKPGAKVTSLRLGAPVSVRTRDPEGIAKAHRDLGYRAAYCPSVSIDDKDRIKEIERAFAKHDVVIAEVGRWCNLLEADPAKRKANLEKVIDGLAVADAVGARCCVDIAGSYNAKVWYGPHPDNVSKKFFDATVENARKIIDAVKPRRAKFGFEMMGWALPDSPDSYLELLKAVDRKAFAVHLDPCNLVNSPRRFYDNTGLIDECFDKLGPHIVSCHAKDLAWDVEMNLHFREVTVGTGSMDYRTYLKKLAQFAPDAPLMLEHCPNQEEYRKGANYLFKLAPEVGVSFG